MDTISTNERETVPFLLFRVRGHRCAMPLVHVVETMRPLPVEAIAGVPVAIKGLSVIRGVPLPVFDVGALLDGDAPLSSRFITVRAGARQIALVVESVEGVRHLSADAFREIPPLLSHSSDEAVAAIGTLDAELLLVLNTARLVPESAWTTIDAAGETS